MGTSLTVLNDNEVQPYTGPAISTGLDDTTRLKPSNLVLIQPVTRDSKGAAPGQFVDTITEEVLNEVTFIPLYVRVKRVLFPEGEFENVQPICRSDDGLVPARGVQTPQSHSCKTCPSGRWFNGQRPPCDEKLSMLVIRKDIEYPTFFQVGGSSIEATRALLGKIKASIQIRKKDYPTLDLYDFEVSVKSTKVVGKKGVYYIPTFFNVKFVGELGKYRWAFDQFVVEPMQQAAAAAQADQVVQNNQQIEGVVDAEIVEA
jgi:hypothetical protein